MELVTSTTIAKIVAKSKLMFAKLWATEFNCVIEKENTLNFTSMTGVMLLQLCIKLFLGKLNIPSIAWYSVCIYIGCYSTKSLGIIYPAQF